MVFRLILHFWGIDKISQIIILDEKVETITQGEAPNTFEAAFSRLKSMVDQGILQPSEK